MRHLPVDRLKIDRSFVTNLIDCAEDRAIVMAIIAMASSLSIEVTAEGVENLRQLMFLQENKCQEAQGFLFSRALPPADAGGPAAARGRDRRRIANQSAAFPDRMIRPPAPAAVWS